MSDYSLRFGGIARLYGTQGAQLLQKSHFCVVGIGGVGSWVAESLARNGIGQITLIDLDDICMSNINRQIHALTDTVGMSKVEVMRDRIKQINPDCQVNIIEDFVTIDNLAELLSAQGMPSQYDYVIDAIDAVDIKTRIIAYCKRNKFTCYNDRWCWWSGRSKPNCDYGFKQKLTQDPLLAKVKNQLRREFNFPRADNS